MVILLDDIYLDIDDDSEYDWSEFSLNGATVKALKHIKRYKVFKAPDKVIRAILLNSLKGQACEYNHFDTAQRDALYHYFKDKDIDDPYILQFMEDTEKIFKHIVAGADNEKKD